MDYLRIGEHKLKITMTEEELLFYGMDLSNLSYSSTETRRAFWAILDDAKHATGFDAAASKVSVQIYACRTGGCEMYIIGEERASSHSEETEEEEFSAYTTAALHCKEESGLTVCPTLPKFFGRAMGRFSKLSDLLSACLALTLGGYRSDSSAWQVGDAYYLHLAGTPPPSTSEEQALGASGLIAEFGETIKDLDFSYLTEHGNCLCSHHAVEQLSKMARSYG